MDVIEALQGLLDQLLVQRVRELRKDLTGGSPDKVVGVFDAGSNGDDGVFITRVSYLLDHVHRSQPNLAAGILHGRAHSLHRLLHANTSDVEHGLQRVKSDVSDGVLLYPLRQVLDDDPLPVVLLRDFFPIFPCELGYRSDRNPADFTLDVPELADVTHQDQLLALIVEPQSLGHGLFSRRISRPSVSQSRAPSGVLPVNMLIHYAELELYRCRWLAGASGSFFYKRKPSLR
mmetsp:Transcript_709/g.1881  ORF Transcript_709/g.1881 Transcript_709/m.1881 type:complete len:232 (-) Transcript_709:734-1429(-)